MALLKAIAPRISINSPVADQVPLWSESVRYEPGAIVLKSSAATDSDSDINITFWVAKETVLANENQPGSNDKWIAWFSTVPGLGFIQNDSDLAEQLASIAKRYDIKYVDLDSDITQLQILTERFRNVDSEFRVLKQRLEIVENKKIIKNLSNNDVISGEAIVWNTAQNKFVSEKLVKSLNNVFPDDLGNVDYTFRKTKVGTRDERLDSDEVGTIFVVANDSDSETNGTSYTFTEGGWLRVIGYTDKENELLFVKKAGDTLTGPLIVSRDPVEDLEVATKKYVDDLSAKGRQKAFKLINTANELVGRLNDSENDILIALDDNTIWRYDGSDYLRFEIPYNNILSSKLLTGDVFSISATNFRVNVKTYRFSNQLTGNLVFTKNGIPLNFYITTNATTQLSQPKSSYNDFRIVNSNIQGFEIFVLDNFDRNANYVLTYTSDTGLETFVRLNKYNKYNLDNNTRPLNFGNY